MARGKANITKLEIIKVATRMFLEKGFTNTSVKAVSDELDISTGNLTFHFPTKEHLLTVLVEMLCEFQQKMMEVAVDEGNSSVMAVCLELTAMAAICEENEIAKDFYLAAYTHRMSLKCIRKSDGERAKQVYAKYCEGWTEAQHVEAEIIVSGIEYATLMSTDDSPLDARITGALNAIMMVYGVPEEKRKQKIQKVLAMDYYEIGRRILREFMEYIKEGNEHALEERMQRNHG